MRLDEGDWVVSGGLTAGWRRMADRRRASALAEVEQARRQLGAQAPAAVRGRTWRAGLDYFLRKADDARDRLLTHPALDQWLFLQRQHFQRPRPARDWRWQLGLFQGLAAALALARSESLEIDATLDPDGHCHLYGSSWVLAFPRQRALKAVRLRIRRGPPETVLAGLGARLIRRREAAPGILIEPCGFLITRAVVMHGLARQTETEERRYAAVLGTALEHIREREAPLHAELCDLLHSAVPLANPMRHGSVSSSYINLRGAVCLSHSDDPLLQAETLIHEFCHQKMNQLLLADPIVGPGQDGQVFYSPWRPDARRLRGLALGAHAFINVARYLVRSLFRDEHPVRQRDSIMRNVARRVLESEAALGTLCAYGRLTDFGARFALGLCREKQALRHAIQWFPRGVIEEAQEAVRRHRRRYSLPLTGLHRKSGRLA